MSVIHRLAGRLFHRTRPCLGDTGSGEGRHDQPQEELEACCWREFSFWSWAGAWVRGGAVANAIVLLAEPVKLCSSSYLIIKLICFFLDNVYKFSWWIVFLLALVERSFILAHHWYLWPEAKMSMYVCLCPCIQIHLCTHRAPFVWFYFVTCLEQRHFSVTVVVSVSCHAGQNNTGSLKPLHSVMINLSNHTDLRFCYDIVGLIFPLTALLNQSDCISA